MTNPAKRAYSFYEKIEGKPYIGQFLVRMLILNGATPVLNDNPLCKELEEAVKSFLPEGCIIRYPTFIFRPVHFFSIFVQNATVAYKFMVYGRAYKVQRFIQSLDHKPKKYRKVWLNGKRKRIAA